MNELQQYYEYLKKSGADVPGDFQSFQKTLSDDASARQYHKYLLENKFDAPEDYDSFATTLGLKKKSGSGSSDTQSQSKSNFGSFPNPVDLVKKDEAPLAVPKYKTDVKPQAQVKESTAIPQKVPSGPPKSSAQYALDQKKQQAYTKLQEHLTNSDDVAAEWIKNNKFQQAGLSYQNNGQDATAMPGVQEPKPDFTATPEEIANLKKSVSEDPTSARAYLNIVAQSRPDKAADIKHAMYLTDAMSRLENENKVGSKFEKVLKNTNKIESGDYDYDINTGTLVEKQDFLHSLSSGLSERFRQMRDYDFYANASDDEAIKKLNEKIANYDPDEPVPVGKNMFADLGQMLGMEGIAMTKSGLATAGAEIVTGGGATPVVPAISAAASAKEYYNRGYEQALVQTYGELKKQGYPDKEAYARAKEQAHQEGLLGAAEGAVSAAVGARLKIRSGMFSGVYKNSLAKILSKTKDFVTHTAVDAGVDAGVAGALQYAKNELAINKGSNRDKWDGVKENMDGEMFFALGVGGAAGAVAGIFNDNSKKERILINGLSRLPESISSILIRNMVAKGALTEDQASVAIIKINKARKINKLIPLNISDESRIKIQDKIEQRSKLEARIESSDKAFHPELKERVKAINEEIVELSKDTVRPSKNWRLTKLLEKEIDNGSLSEEDADIAKAAISTDGGVDAYFKSIANDVDIDEQAARKTYGDILVDKAIELRKQASDSGVSNKIGTSDNTESILDLAEKSGGIYSKLATSIRKLLNGVTTIVTDDFKSDVSKSGDYGENVIRINNKTNFNKLHIFFHEALHHITLSKIQEFETNPTSTNLKPHEVEAILNLKRIFKIVTEKLNKDAGGYGTQKEGVSSTNLWLLDSTGDNRGLANVHEFISEAFSNPEFQKILKNFKGEGNRPNLFSEFLSFIAKMLGLKDPTILDDVFYHTEQLVDIGNEQPTKETNENKKFEKALEIHNKKGNPVIGDVSDSEYNDFIDKGKVSEERLFDIADKVKNQKQLTDRETEIFTDKTSDINKIISSQKNNTQNETQKTSEASQAEVLGEPMPQEEIDKWLNDEPMDPVDQEVLDENFEDLINEYEQRESEKAVPESEPQQSEGNPEQTEQDKALEEEFLRGLEELVPSALTKLVDPQFFRKSKDVVFRGEGGNASVLSNRFGDKFKYFTDNPYYAAAFTLDKDTDISVGVTKKYQTNFKNPKSFYSEDEYRSDVAKYNNKSKNLLDTDDFNNYNTYLKDKGNDVIEVRRNEPVVPREKYNGSSISERNVELKEYILLDPSSINFIAERSSGSSPLSKLTGRELSESVDITKEGANVTLEDLGITDSDNIADIVTKLSDLDSPLSPMLQYIRDNANFKNIKLEYYEPGQNNTLDWYIRVHNINPNNIAGLYFNRATFEDHSYWGKLAGTIVINKNSYANQYLSTVHELLHWYTLDSNIAKNLGFLGKAKLAEYKTLFEFIKKQKPVDNGAAYNPATYGLKNFEEWMVEVMMSPELRDNVKDIYAKNRKEIYAKTGINFGSVNDFVASLKDMFRTLMDKLMGLAYNNRSQPIYDRTIDIAESLFFGDNKVVDRSLKKGRESSLGGTNSSVGALAMPSVDEKNSIINSAKENNTYHLAPNGEKSNLSEDQWVIVRSKAFKNWFGDWENNPQNSSKVLDANGEPMVVYHATKDNISVFDYDKTKGGIFFTTSKKDAINFYKQLRGGGNPVVIETYLNIKNPKYYQDFHGDYVEKASFVYKGDRKKLNENLKSEGYDGIMSDDKGWNDTYDDDYNYTGSNSDQYVAFSPEQIKSATDNSGDFSKNNPSILMKPVSGDPISEYIEKYRGKISDQKIQDLLRKKGIDPAKYFEYEKEPGKKAILNRANEGKNPEEVKAFIRKIGLRQDVESIDEARKQADALIDYLGMEGALRAVRDKEIDGSAGTLIWGRIIKKVGEEYRAEKDPVKKTQLANEQAYLYSEFSDLYTEKGRSLNALKQVYLESEDAYRFYINKEIDKGNADTINAESKKVQLIKQEAIKAKKEAAELLSENAELKSKLFDLQRKRPRETRKSQLAEKLKGLFNKVPLMMPAATTEKFNFTDPDLKEYVGMVYQDAEGDFNAFTDELVNTLGEGAREKAQDFFDYFNQSDSVDVKGALKDKYGKNYSKVLTDLAKEYYLAGEKEGKNLSAYLAEKAGVPESEVADFSKEIEAKFDELLNKRVLSEIERAYPLPVVPIKRAKAKKEYQRMTEAINLGLKTGLRKDGTTFDFEKEFYDKFGLINTNEPNVREKLDGFAKKMYDNKGNDLYHSLATVEMLDWVANRRQESRLAAALVEQMYANMLYGQDTHIRNSVFNVQKVFMSLAEMTTLKPGSAKVIMKAFMSGMDRGSKEMISAIMTGHARSGDAPTVRKFSERVDASPAWKLWAKYANKPSRFLSALDSAMNFPLRKARLAFILLDELKEKYPDMPLKERQQAVDRLINGDGKRDEWEQKAEEDTRKFYDLQEPMFVDGKRNPVYAASKFDEAYRNFTRSFYNFQEQNIDNEGVFEEAKDYSDASLLIGKPKGYFGLGAALLNSLGHASPVLKILTSPFVNVPFNVAAHVFEFSPLGWSTVMLGKEGFGINADWAKRNGVNLEMNPRRKQQLIWKAAVGTTGMAAVAALTQFKYKDDDGEERPVLIVTADGTGNYTKNKKLEKLSGKDKFEEYSVDFMGTKISYKYSPFAAWFLPIGYYSDAERYGKGGNEIEVDKAEALAKATAGLIYFMKDQSSIQGLSDLLNIGDKTGAFRDEASVLEKGVKQLKVLGANTLRNILLPNFIPQSYRQYKGFMEREESEGVSFTDRLTKDIPFLDQFAGKRFDHFGRPINSRWRIPGVYANPADDDPLYDLMRTKGYIDNLRYFNANYIKDYNGETYMLTQDQTREISEETNKLAGKRILDEFSELANLDPQQFKKEMNKIYQESLLQTVQDRFPVTKIRNRFTGSDEYTPKE